MFIITKSPPKMALKKNTHTHTRENAEVHYKIFTMKVSLGDGLRSSLAYRAERLQNSDLQNCPA